MREIGVKSLLMTLGAETEPGLAIYPKFEIARTKQLEVSVRRFSFASVFSEAAWNGDALLQWHAINDLSIHARQSVFLKQKRLNVFGIPGRSTKDCVSYGRHGNFA